MVFVVYINLANKVVGYAVDLSRGVNEYKILYGRVVDKSTGDKD